MITKSVYGFGYGHTGRVVGAEPDQPIEPAKTYDAQEDIDYCLSCPQENCKGSCKRLRALGYNPIKRKKEDFMSITHETRREAFERVEPRSMRMKITKLLTDNGPMTSSEIMEKMGLQNYNSVRPRLTELKADGVIQAVGKRKNRCGANEAVWEIAV